MTPSHTESHQTPPVTLFGDFFDGREFLRARYHTLPACGTKENKDIISPTKLHFPIFSRSMETTAGRFISIRDSSIFI